MRRTNSAAWKVVSASTYEPDAPPPNVSLDDAGERFTGSEFHSPAVIPAGLCSSIKVQGLAMNAAVEAANPSPTAVHVVGGGNNGISGFTA